MQGSDPSFPVTYDTLMKESARQLTVCNACRYCEGFCPVWDVIEYRREFAKGDIEYIANLCHDCGQCFDVCPFTPPNQFSIDIPAILSEVRTQTYEEYVTPKAASVVFNNRAGFSIALFGFSFLGLIVAYFLYGNPTRILDSFTGKGSFYAIFPNIFLDAAGTLLALFFLAAWLSSGLKFMRGSNRSGRIGIRDLFSALLDSLAQEWLRGGGAGCNYPDREEVGSYRKFSTHALVMYGFILDLLATLSAFVEQDFLGIYPPYPPLSLPVIFGLSGGIMIIAGVGLFLYYDSKGGNPRSRKMEIMDRIFLLTLLMTATTGIVLFAMRSTTFMGTLLLIHLSFVALLFISAPYGKFIHIVFRYLAIARYHSERRAFQINRS
ncbi:MAG: tricarballylate utilization 4Fe-4S protein TcuB [Thermoplasmataceae archaeon]